MNDESAKTDHSRDRRLGFILLFSWVIFFAAFVLIVSIFVGPGELIEALDELEEAETQQVSLDRRIPSTLKPLTETAPTSLISNRAYVPFYRTLYVEEDRAVSKLAATLSVHNTSSENGLIVNKLTYFDGNGETIVERLKEPHILPPLASAEFYVGQQQSEIAAAVLEWSGEAASSPPLIEAIIVGKYGAKGFSVISRGVKLP